jgi:hypothetical protein
LTIIKWLSIIQDIRTGSDITKLAAIASITGKTLGVMGNQWPIEMSNREE